MLPNLLQLAYYKLEKNLFEKRVLILRNLYMQKEVRGADPR